jgi:hypothetical protein
MSAWLGILLTEARLKVLRAWSLLHLHLRDDVLPAGRGSFAGIFVRELRRS